MQFLIDLFTSAEVATPGVPSGQGAQKPEGHQLDQEPGGALARSASKRARNEPRARDVKPGRDSQGGATPSADSTSGIAALNAVSPDWGASRGHGTPSPLRTFLQAAQPGSHERLVTLDEVDQGRPFRLRPDIQEFYASIGATTKDESPQKLTGTPHAAPKKFATELPAKLPLTQSLTPQQTDIFDVFYARLFEIFHDHGFITEAAFGMLSVCVNV